MEIKSKVEVNFHQQDEASVFIENSSSGKEEKFGEVVLACCFILRTLMNLGKGSEVSDSLAYSIRMIGGDLKSFLNYSSPNVAKLVDSKSSQGRKRFEASLTVKGSDINFKYYAKGFGLLARGVGYYSPNSVLILLRYLLNKRLKDREYFNAMEKALKYCANVYDGNQVSVFNQSTIALQIATESYSYR